MPPNGTKNLIPINTRTKEEQKKIAKMGGIASGKARKQKKTIMEYAKAINNSPVKSSDTLAALRSIGISEDNPTHGAVIAAAVYRAAMEGDMRAVEKWEQYVGEAQKQAGDGGVKVIIDV